MIPIDPITPIHEQFRAVSEGWFNALFQPAVWVFNTLIVVELVVTMMQHLRDNGYFWATLIDRIFKILFFRLILVNAGWMLPSVINGFVELGTSASGVSAMNPFAVVVQGVEIAGKLGWQMLSWTFFSHPISLCTGIFCMLGIVVAYTAMGYRMCSALVEGFVVAGAGVLLLGFGGWRGTSEMTLRYISYIVGVGIRLFMLYLIIGAGMPFAEMWGRMISEVTVETIYTPVALLAGIIIFAGLAWSIPNYVATIAVGSLGQGVQDPASTGMGVLQTAASVVSTAAMGAAGLGNAYQIGKQTSLNAGGGMHGMMTGMGAAGSAFAYEAAAASVPRLSRGVGNLQNQREALEKRSGGGSSSGTSSASGSSTPPATPPSSGTSGPRRRP
jgi:type IV secretion system protein TrbL